MINHKIIRKKPSYWVGMFAVIISVSVPWKAHATNAKGWVVNLEQGEGSVEFVAVGRPKAIRILGKGEAAKGQLKWDQESKGAGKVTFALSSLDTGIKLRTEHMKQKYLEVDQYPEATLQITSISIPPEKAMSDFSIENFPFTAQLSLHGVSKPIQGTATVKRGGNNLQIESKFAINISDFKIEVPRYMGITVADEVLVEMHAEAPITIRP